MSAYHREVHQHQFAWLHVAASIFRRYPNRFSTHVLSEDTVHRSLISPHVLYTRRLLTKTNSLPAWGVKLIFGKNRDPSLPVMEESFVDRQKKVITLYTRNIGLSKVMSAVEKVQYRIDPANPSTSTIVVKEAWIASKFCIKNTIINFGLERFKKNCKRATEGFNQVLERRKNQLIHLGTDLSQVKLPTSSTVYASDGSEETAPGLPSVVQA